MRLELGQRGGKSIKYAGWGLFILPFFVFLLCFPAWANYFSPSDSVPLTIGTLSINADSVQDCDSIRIKWWRSSAGWTYVGTKKLTSSVENGFYATNIKASDVSDQPGNYTAKAVAYKFGGSCTDIKTWSWIVVAMFDSLTNAICDINKANFKADVSDLLGKGDSSLYMRTDWNDVKNQDAAVNFTHTRLAYVDTVDSVNEVLADTSQIKNMNDNNQWGASWVWNYPARTLTSGAGSGANGVVIRCKSSADDSPVALTQIQVLDSTESSTIGLLTSDSQGRGFFALDNGIYCVRLFKPGWQFTVPETLEVNGNEDTSYYAAAFDPGTPLLPNLCRVYGWIYDIKNQPVVGAKVEASIKRVPLRYQNVIISPYYQSSITDDEGYWYLDLYPNSFLNPSGTRYTFNLFSPSGTILKLEIEIPDQGSWELQW
ncbi:MAG TPA: hypothetical protein VF369_08260 [candidate division Zixibacteria bacterium]